VTFIRQHARDQIERVRVRRILAQRHQEHRVILPDAVIHSLLQRRFLFGNEIVVADDIVDFHGRSIAKRCSDCARQGDRESGVLSPGPERKFECRAAGNNFGHCDSRVAVDR
jgi:hypothetical protein